jgi:hypothetical protein
VVHVLPFVEVADVIVPALFPTITHNGSEFSMPQHITVFALNENGAVPYSQVEPEFDDLAVLCVPAPIITTFVALAAAATGFFISDKEENEDNILYYSGLLLLPTF